MNHCVFCLNYYASACIIMNISNRHRAQRLLLIYQIVDTKSMQIKAKSGNNLFFTANNYVGKKALLKKMHVRDSRHFIKLANVA